MPNGDAIDGKNYALIYFGRCFILSFSLKYVNKCINKREAYMLSDQARSEGYHAVAQIISGL